MSQREQSDERGFTIVELLVVLLVVALLSAIAIPAFLHQRERAHEAQAEAALKQAAGAMESYATRTNGKYTGAMIATLRDDEGLRIPTGVTYPSQRDISRDPPTASRLSTPAFRHPCGTTPR